MTTPMNDGEEAYELVMPFLPVISVGGPYDDEAYVAGWEMAKLDSMLANSPDKEGHLVRSANLEQADLIAMKHGSTMTARENEGLIGYSLVDFKENK